MALVSERISSTSVEAREFPELSGHYEVSSVPKIVVNETFDFVGGYPEQQFVELILSSVTGSTAGPNGSESTAV